jgi:hypothetical protein
MFEKNKITTTKPNKYEITLLSHIWKSVEALEMKWNESTLIVIGLLLGCGEWNESTWVAIGLWGVWVLMPRPSTAELAQKV